MLRINNKTISTPIIDILKQIKAEIHNGKLRDIKVTGDNIRVTCPFHKDGLENKPSCDIYIGDSLEVETGTYNCFTCSERGPFYKFVAACFDETEDFAKEWLIERFADGFIEQSIILDDIDLSRKTKTYLDENILANYEDYHPYMLKRKLTKQVCEQFEVKYDSNNKCLIFPVRDEKGRLSLITRRSVINKTFIIDAEKEKPVYLLYYLLKNDIKEAYVCESQINALTCWTHNIPGIALFGTGSKKQYEILNKSSIRVYHLLFDGDAAGDNGIKKFLKNIRDDVIVDIIKVPKGKDINDLSYDEFENLIKYTV